MTKIVKSKIIFTNPETIHGVNHLTVTGGVFFETALTAGEAFTKEEATGTTGVAGASIVDSIVPW